MIDFACGDSSSGVLRWPVEKSHYECWTADEREFREWHGLGTRGWHASIDRLHAAAGRLNRARGNASTPFLCIRPIEPACSKVRLRESIDFAPLQTHRRFYDPMERVGLFRRFAKMRRSPDAVVKFANRSGLLQSDAEESLSHWYAEIDSLRRAVALYDHACKCDEGSLHHLLLSSSGETGEIDRSRAALFDRVDWMRPSDQVPGGCKARVDRLMREIFSGDIVAAALSEVRGEINARLHGRVSAVIADQDQPFPDSVGLAYVPKDLLCALWLQFALQVSGLRERRPCQGPNCRTSFWLKTGAAEGRQRAQRATSMYCSPACKQAAYRKSKAERALNDTPRCPLCGQTRQT